LPRSLVDGTSFPSSRRAADLTIPGSGYGFTVFKAIEPTRKRASAR
jgi:hypothetical protein